MRRHAYLLVIGLAAVACTNEYSLAFGAGAGDDASEPAVDLGAQVFLANELSDTSPTAPPQPISLGFVGDVQMVGSMAEHEPLVGVTELLSSPDLTFANLETVIGDAEEVGTAPIDKEYIFRSPPETLDQMVAAGIDVVGLANNHAWDYGPRGARVTRAHVDASSLIGVGVGDGPADAYAPRFVEVEGRTVGVVSLSRVPCDWAGDPAADRPEIAWACDRFASDAAAAIAMAEAASDVTVVMLHGGTEVTDCPDPALRSVVGSWVGLGADVVSISHPHVLQGVEIVDGAAVLWSTGNFAFQNGGGRTARSAMFEVVFGEGGPEITMHPTVLPGAVATPADPGAAALIVEEVSARSVGGRFGPDGVLVPDAEPSLCG